MKLIIGGYAQGKLQYVLQEKSVENCVIYEAELPTQAQMQEADRQGKQIIINHFHKWVKRRILEQGAPEEEIRDFFRQNQEIIVISDEIGNGIVPVDAQERAYRERTGRILVEMAKKADEVVRVICGIGQKIKSN